MVSQSQTRFANLFGSETVTQMNMIFNRLHWPILVFFIFKEKTSVMNANNAVTLTDFKNNMIWNAHTYDYLRMLIVNKKQLIERKDDMFEKTKYALTPYGRKIAVIMWNVIEYHSKSEGKSIEEYCAKIKNTLELSPDAEDEEEKVIKQLEENAKKAGVTMNEDGNNIIDLEKVKI